MEDKVTRYKLHKVKTKWVTIGTTLCGSILAAASSGGVQTASANDVTTASSSSNVSAEDSAKNVITSSSLKENSTSSSSTSTSDSSSSSSKSDMKTPSISSSSAVGSKSAKDLTTNFAVTNTNADTNASANTNSNSNDNSDSTTNNNAVNDNSDNSTATNTTNSSDTNSNENATSNLSDSSATTDNNVNNSSSNNTTNSNSTNTTTNSSSSNNSSNGSFDLNSLINDNPYHIEGVYDKYKLANNGNIYNNKAFEYTKNGSLKEVNVNDTYWNLMTGHLCSKEDNMPLIDESGNMIYSNTYNYGEAIYDGVNPDYSNGEPYNSAESQKTANNFNQPLNYLNDSVHGMVQDTMPAVTNNGVAPAFGDEGPNSNLGTNNAYSSPDVPKNETLLNNMHKYADGFGYKVVNSDGSYYYPIDANVSANYFFGQDPAKLKAALTDKLDDSIYNSTNGLTNTKNDSSMYGRTEWQVIGSDGSLTDNKGMYPFLTNNLQWPSLLDDDSLTQDQTAAIENIIKSTYHINCDASTVDTTQSPDSMFYGTLLPDGTLLANDMNCTRIIPLKREMTQQVIDNFNQPVDQEVTVDGQKVLVPKYLVDQVNNLHGLTDAQNKALLGILQGLTTSITPGHVVGKSYDDRLQDILPSNWVSAVQTVIDNLQVDSDGNLTFGADQYHRDRTLHVYTAPNGMIQIKIDKNGNVYYDKNSLQDTTFNWYIQSGIISENNGLVSIKNSYPDGIKDYQYPGQLSIPISARALNYLSKINMPDGSTNGFDRLNDEDSKVQNAYNKDSSYEVTFSVNSEIKEFYGLPDSVNLNNTNDDINKVAVDKAPLTSAEFENQVSGLPFIISVGPMNWDADAASSASVVGLPAITIHYVNKLTGKKIQNDYDWDYNKAADDTKIDGDDSTYIPPEEIKGLKYVGYNTADQLPLTINYNNYTNGLYPNNQITVYYMPQGSADIKYINTVTGREMDNLPPKDSNGDVGGDYNFDEPEVPGYKITKVDGNISGKYEEDNPQHVIVYYTPQSSADIKYINKLTGEEMPTLPPKSSEGDVDASFSWDEPEVPGYKIVSTDGPKDGKYEQDKVQHTIVYYMPQGGADIKYINKLTSEEMPTLPMKDSNGDVGASFSWDEPEVPGYKIVSTDGPKDGKYEQDKVQHTIVYYMPQGNADVKYVNSVTGEEMPGLPPKSSNGNVGDSFNWDKPEVPGYQITKVDGNLSGKYEQDNPQHTIIYYTPEAQKGNADIKYINSVTGEEMPTLPPKSSEGDIGSSFNWDEPEVPGFKITKVDGNLNGKYSKDTQHTIVYYTPDTPEVQKGNADIKYVNAVTGEEMPALPPKSSEGNIGDSFSWDKPEVPGFKITKVDGNLNGKYSKDTQHTIVYYTPDTPEVQKGSADVKYINSVTGKEMPNLPMKSSEGNIGDAFSWDEPEVPGYKIVKVTGNLNGKYSKDTQHTIVYYMPIEDKPTTNEVKEQPQVGSPEVEQPTKQVVKEEVKPEQPKVINEEKAQSQQKVVEEQPQLITPAKADEVKEVAATPQQSQIGSPEELPQTGDSASKVKGIIALASAGLIGMIGSALIGKKKED